jgi:LPS-assembly protein
MPFPKSDPARRVLHLAFLGLMVTAAPGALMAALAATPPPAENTAATADQVDFASENLEYDEINQTITASGKVEIAQAGRVVQADQVVYSLKTEAVEAKGNVVMMEPSGDVHFADQVNLEHRFKDGYVRKLRSVLADGSRFTAEEGHRINGERVEMSEATYTPCEPCKANPEKSPLWQLKADKVTHDTRDHSISYEDARLEFQGVPVAYTPYFSHPDGTIKQKSGFLPPTFSLGSQTGFGINNRYYWAISPSEDMTIGARAFTAQAPLLSAEYRRRYDNARLELNGSTTYAKRKDSRGDETITIDEEVRGHLSGNGLWDIDDQWRAGFRGEVTSDDQYLRQYGISNNNVLENEIFAERFENRDYFSARALAFQDVRVSDRSTDQPNIVPEVEANFLGVPGEMLGGRWSLDLSALGLRRKGNGQDVARGSAEAGWQRRDVAGFGLVNTLSASVRGDAYSMSDRDPDLIGAGGEGDAVASRLFPQIHNVTSYPIARRFDAVQAVIEPTVSVAVATNVENDTDIPNEDSQDVQVDALNIFAPDRFPGKDRAEDRTHMAYGLRTGLYDDDGSKGEVFLGQSFRPHQEDNPFPEGSGLSTQTSDVVGSVQAQYQDDFRLDYRFQLGSANLESRRHEVDAFAKFDDLTLSSTYLYARALEGTDLTDSREQIYGAASYMLTEEWQIRSGARYDFGETEGLRHTNVGLDYLGQCMTVSANARRSFTLDETGENGTEVTLRIGLKNLGEFGTGE